MKPAVVLAIFALLFLAAQANPNQLGSESDPVMQAVQEASQGKFQLVLNAPGPAPTQESSSPLDSVSNSLADLSAPATTTPAATSTTTTTSSTAATTTASTATTTPTAPAAANSKPATTTASAAQPVTTPASTSSPSTSSTSTAAKPATTTPAPAPAANSQPATTSTTSTAAKPATTTPAPAPAANSQPATTSTTSTAAKPATTTPAPATAANSQPATTSTTSTAAKPATTTPPVNANSQPAVTTPAATAAAPVATPVAPAVAGTPVSPGTPLTPLAAATINNNNAAFSTSAFFPAPNPPPITTPGLLPLDQDLDPNVPTYRGDPQMMVDGSLTSATTQHANDLLTDLTGYQKPQPTPAFETLQIDDKLKELWNRLKTGDPSLPQVHYPIEYTRWIPNDDPQATEARMRAMDAVEDSITQTTASDPQTIDEAKQMYVNSHNTLHHTHQSLVRLCKDGTCPFPPLHALKRYRDDADLPVESYPDRPLNTM